MTATPTLDTLSIDAAMESVGLVYAPYPPPSDPENGTVLYSWFADRASAIAWHRTREAPVPALSEASQTEAERYARERGFPGIVLVWGGDSPTESVVRFDGGRSFDRKVKGER